MYYKVVSKVEDKLVSACACSLFPVSYKLGLEYKVGEWTFPAEGTKGIFIFDNLDNALDFMSNNGEYPSVYECEAEGVELCDSICFGILSEILNFWNDNIYQFGNSAKRGKYCASYAPKGSYIAKSVKLIKEVECKDC